MKRRAFRQNKLWRDQAVQMMEETGSIVHWTRLDDAEYDAAYAIVSVLLINTLRF